MITSQRQRRSSVGGVTRSWDRPGYRFSPDGVPAIPASEFGNPATYERELATMLRPGHGLMYLGHDLMLPGKGHRVADGDPRVVLTRDDDGAVRALAYMCTHSLRPLLENNDFVDKSCITCPFHQWSFRRDGTLIGARDMTFGEYDFLSIAEAPSEPRWPRCCWQREAAGVSPISRRRWR